MEKLYENLGFAIKFKERHMDFPQAYENHIEMVNKVYDSLHGKKIEEITNKKQIYNVAHRLWENATFIYHALNNPLGNLENFKSKKLKKALQSNSSDNAKCLEVCLERLAIQSENLEDGEQNKRVQEVFNYLSNLF